MVDLTPLTHSAERLAALVEQTDAEREVRNELICEAIDAGEGFKAVARAARLKSVATVAGIVAAA